MAAGMVRVGMAVVSTAVVIATGVSMETGLSTGHEGCL
jgi:hypothetical protein